MDDTKKTLLTIDIDTTALNQNVTTAKAAVLDLTNQLKALKAAGQDVGPVFDSISKQLKTSTDDLNKSTAALKAYNDALGKKPPIQQTDTKSQVQQTDTQPTVDSTSSNTPVTDLGSPKSTMVIQQEDSPVQKLPPLPVTEDPSVKRLAALKKYNDDVIALNATALSQQKNDVKEELEVLDTKTKAYTDSANTIAAVIGKSTEVGKAAVLAKKAFGAAEIAINTEQQISSIYLGTEYAVTQDRAVPIIGPILAAIDIAGGIVRVAAAVANGAQQVSKLNSITVPSAPTKASAARGGIFISDGNGGYLTGPGSGTSDSINAYLSNGESIINARSTQMFAPILSAINQIGGGRAFSTNSSNGAYALGGLFNGSNALNDGSNDLANTRAMNQMAKTLAASLPRQVLVVEDVQASLQNKVMLQNMSNF